MSKSANRNAIRFEDAFVATGSWWKPGEQEKENVAGTLRYDPVTGIELDLWGCPFEWLTDSPGSLHGHTEPFGGVLLSGLMEKGSGFASARTPWGGVTSMSASFQVSHAFIGGYFATDEVAFDTYSVRYPTMNEWFGHKPFAGPSSPLSYQDVSPALEYTAPPTVEFTLPNGLRIRFSSGVATNTPSPFQTEWTFGTRVELSGAERRPTSWFADAQKRFAVLLSMLSGHPAIPDHIHGLVKEETAMDSQLVSVLYSQTAHPSKREAITSGVFIPFESLADDLPTIAERWFELSATIEPAMDILYTSLTHPLPFAEPRFLIMAQAVEMYHRGTVGGEYLTDKEWDPMRRDLMDGVPESCSDDLKESIRERLRYANHLTLRSRIRGLLERLPESVTRHICSDPEDFAASCTRERNLLTHYPANYRTKLMDGDRRFRATRALRVLLVASILHDIGVDDDLIARRLDAEHPSDYTFRSPAKVATT